MLAAIAASLGLKSRWKSAEGDLLSSARCNFRWKTTLTGKERILFLSLRFLNTLFSIIIIISIFFQKQFTYHRSTAILSTIFRNLEYQTITKKIEFFSPTRREEEEEKKNWKRMKQITSSCRNWFHVSLNPSICGERGVRVIRGLYTRMHTARSHLSFRSTCVHEVFARG